jgi:hypothetical protein
MLPVSTGMLTVSLEAQRMNHGHWLAGYKPTPTSITQAMPLVRLVRGGQLKTNAVGLVL